MSKHLENAIEKIRGSLLVLGGLIEENLQDAVLAVKEKNRVLAREVISRDRTVDLAEVELEEDCLKVLALHQPVAIDLRIVVAALKINNDLERIGDLAVNIAERAEFLSSSDSITAPFDFDTMASKVRIMLKNALDSMIGMNSEIARSVCAADDEVDQINREMYRTVYERLRVEPQNAESLIHYLSISRHLERIADYATNISEDIIYMIEGEIVRHKPNEFLAE